MHRQRLATASSSGMLALCSSIFLIITGLLFIGFGEEFTKRLAPLFSVGSLSLIAGILCITFAIFEIIGGILVYTFKYTIGGIIILIISFVSIFVGGGFYITTLWGMGSGIIALICPSLEEKILENKTEKKIVIQ
ncbi:MAG: hypothetical protein ACTSO9_15830 [Candidatus Helarchaeota archaeon]